MVDDNFYLELAIKEAWKTQCQTLPNPAVGALILDYNGKILALQAHQEAGKPHAEVLALKEAYFNLTQDSTILSLEQSTQIHEYLKQKAHTLFLNTTLYVTLEPCMHKGKTPSCAALIESLGIKKLIIGAKDPNPKAQGGAEYLQQRGCKIIKAWENKELQKSSIKANDLLLPFNFLQKKGNFVLFKYACRLNGSIDGGQISSKETQIFMHNLRCKLDELIISGKSVLIDNPILDSRSNSLQSQKNPNIAILTHQKDFPQTAPLFSIPNRQVRILHSLSDFSGFIMCEGGTNLLQNLLPQIDMLLIFLSPTLSTYDLAPHFNASFKLLHSQPIGNDLALWLLPKEES